MKETLREEKPSGGVKLYFYNLLASRIDNSKGLLESRVMSASWQRKSSRGKDRMALDTMGDCLSCGGGRASRASLPMTSEKSSTRRLLRRKVFQTGTNTMSNLALVVRAGPQLLLGFDCIEHRSSAHTS